MVGEKYDNLARSRIYSSLFSRRVVREVLKGQYESIDKICAFLKTIKDKKHTLNTLLIFIAL